MYEIHLENGEIINYNKPVRIEVEGRIHHVGLVVTNLHLMIFEDVQRKLDFQEILRTARGVQSLPSYELILKEKINLIKSSYDGENTILQIKEKFILVLGEKIPLPVL